MMFTIFKLLRNAYVHTYIYTSHVYIFKCICTSSKYVERDGWMLHGGYGGRETRKFSVALAYQRGYMHTGLFGCLSPCRLPGVQ